MVFLRLGLKADLIEKGLRHMSLSSSAASAGLKADLIEKGLRHRIEQGLRHGEAFESRPDREGIKTLGLRRNRLLPSV